MKKNTHAIYTHSILVGLFIILCTPFTFAQTNCDSIIGFGRLTTGGAGGPEVTVTTAEELIKAAASKGPLIINVKGNIVHEAGGGGDDDRIWIASNKTIQGVDKNASIDGNLTNAREDENCSNIIIRNIRLQNPSGKGTGDAIEFTNGVTNIWVDHVSFGQCKDGACDFKRGADFATVSYCKFSYTSTTHGHNYANLVGHSDIYPELDRGKLRVTFHHNWWAENVIERMPRVRYGQVHVFNNYYSSNRTNYIVGVGVEAQILFEGNYVHNQNGPNGSWYDWYPASKCVEACDAGKIEWRNNRWDNSTISTWAQNSDVFDPPYPYTPDNANSIKDIVMKHAGSFGRLPCETTNSRDISSLAFNVYPNPVNNILYIKLEKEAGNGAVVQLIDITGRVIENSIIGVDQVSLDMSDLQPGIYLLKLSNLNESVVKQIIKQ